MGCCFLAPWWPSSGSANSPSTSGCVRESGGKAAVQREETPFFGIGRQGTAHLILPILPKSYDLFGGQVFFYCDPEFKGWVGKVTNPTFWGCEKIMA